MFMPRFSIKWLLGVTTAMAVFSLFVSWGLGGSNWAWGVAIGAAALAVAFLIHAAVFGLLSLLATSVPRFKARADDPDGWQRVESQAVSGNGQGKIV